MSKAFTSEEHDPEPVLPSAQRAGGARRPITPRGWRSLQQQLHHLVEVERPALAQAPPLDRPVRQAELEARIQALASTLAHVDVVPAVPGQDRVVFGAGVELRDGRGRRRRYQVVGPDEVDPARGQVSVQSPLAEALLGHAVGETVDVELPRGDEQFTILAVTPGQE